MAPRLRLGILGAARNVPFSVLQPVRANPDLAGKIDVVGLASLEQAEAQMKAKEWGIPRAYASFEEMLADPEIDAVYNVLPNPVRCSWTIQALLAGKHVLSETPMTSNAREAVVAQRCSENVGRVLLEGTHPTCHPTTKRVREIISTGKIGKLEEISLDLPIGHALEGKMVCAGSGAMMSLGCHGVAILRALCGEEPKVVSASAQFSKDKPDVDSVMRCRMELPDGAVAHLGCSVVPESNQQPTTFTIVGSNGTIRVKEWFTGQGKSSNEILLETFEENGENFKERVNNPISRDTFYFQLMTFVNEVREQEKRQEAIGLPWSYSKNTGPSDTVRNMAIIDAIYKAANMKPRSTTNPPPAPYDHIGKSKL